MYIQGETIRFYLVVVNTSRHRIRNLEITFDEDKLNDYLYPENKKWTQSAKIIYPRLYHIFSFRFKTRITEHNLAKVKLHFSIKYHLNQDKIFTHYYPIEIFWQKPQNPNAPPLSTSKTIDTISLIWGYTYRATKFEIYKNDKLYASTNKTNHQVSGLTNGETYHFKVRAGNNAGWSDFSPDVSVTTLKRLYGKIIDAKSNNLVEENCRSFCVPGKRKMFNPRAVPTRKGSEFYYDVETGVHTLYAYANKYTYAVKVVNVQKRTRKQVIKLKKVYK